MKCYCFGKFHPATSTTLESSIANPTQPDDHVIITTALPGDGSNPGGDHISNIISNFKSS